MNTVTARLQYLGDETPELSVTAQPHLFLGRNGNLFQDLAGGGQRLGENRVLGGDGIRQHVQVPLRQREQLAENARVFHNSQHGAMRAVAAQFAPAPLAAAAGQIDFADHAPAHQRAIVRFHHHADELVPRCAAKTVVAALELEVGVADAAAQQADEREASGAAGRPAPPHLDAAVFQVNGEHEPVPV